MFFRLAVSVTLVLWLPDLYLLDLGQPGRRGAVLMVMHLAIALVTYNCLVHIASVKDGAPPSCSRPGTGGRPGSTRGALKVLRMRTARVRTLADAIWPEPLAAKVPEITFVFG